MGAAGPRGAQPTGSSNAYYSALQQQAGQRAGIPLAGNRPVSPVAPAAGKAPSKEELDAYKKLKETELAASNVAKATAPAAPMATPPQGITMGPGTASRSF